MIVNNSWCEKVKEILTLLNKEELFEERSLYSLNTFEEDINPTIETEWKIKVESKPKLRTFKTFKCHYHVSDYAVSLQNRYLRSLLAKFRLGILQLHIETGRFTQTKLEERVCRICNNGNIEDELHFLCTCVKYDDLRTCMYDNVSELNDNFYTLTDKDKFVFLLNHCNKQVAHFLKCAWERRKLFVYN
jgi:hypothetical protein